MSSPLELHKIEHIQLGFAFLDHAFQDQLILNIAEDSFDKLTYSGTKLVNLTTWTNNTMLTKIREEIYTYIGNKIDTITLIQYDYKGIEVERYVEIYSYIGNRITNIERDMT